MKKILRTLILFGGGAAIGVLLGKSGIFSGLENFPKPYVIILLISLPFIFFLVTGLHELGHVAVGRTQNFQFYGLTVGPFSWKADPGGKIKFAWNTKLNLSGGVAFMVPNGTENLARRFIRFAAGGPLASIVLALFAVFLTFLLPDGSLGKLIVGTIGIFSALIALVTLIPSRAGGFSSDGMRILTLLRDTPAAHAEMTVLRIVTQMRAGLPVADFPIEEVRQYVAAPGISNQHRVSLRFYEYVYALHTAGPEQAAPILAEFMEQLDVYPKGLREIFYLEAAFFAACYQEDLAAAKAAMGKYKTSPFAEVAYLHLSKAGIARLEGDRETWQSEFQAAEKLLPQLSDQTRAAILQQMINQWKTELGRG